MKTFDLKKLGREAKEGEYVLGAKDLHTHACYMIYGELKPGEKQRKVCPGEGHEEIVMAVSGDLHVSGGAFEGVIPEGHAAHFKETEACYIENPGQTTAVYIMAGGHSGKHH